jgi:uncharacterized membrane protein YbhN (UPF0104 family)
MARRLRVAVVLGVIGLVLFTLRDSVPDLEEIWGAVQGASLGWLAVAMGAELVSMRLFARLLRRLLGLGGIRLTLPRALAVTYARNAMSNSLPAGPVLSIAFTIREFGRLGAGKPLAAATLVLSALYSTGTFVMLGLVALLGNAATSLPTAIVLAAAVAAVALLVRLRPRGIARWLSRRHPGAAMKIQATRQAITMAGRDRLALLALALANWLLDLACLAAVCAAAGVGLGPHKVLLAYVAAKAAATVAVIPGGLGVTEVGMAATFVAAGVTGGTAAAVVVLYRLISYWAVLVMGWLAWLMLRDGVRARLAAAGRRLGLRDCPSPGPP